MCTWNLDTIFVVIDPDMKQIFGLKWTRIAFPKANPDRNEFISNKIMNSKQQETNRANNQIKFLFAFYHECKITN